MTNHWVDIKNASGILAIGCNPAENHPGTSRFMQWAMERNNAPLVVVDPRKTRTATLADQHVQIRPGTDVAFIYGMLNHILIGDPLAGHPYAANRANCEAFLGTYSTARTFQADNMQTVTFDGLGGAGTLARGVEGLGWPKYSDARFKVRTDGTYDYQRVNYNTGGSQVSNMPAVDTNINGADTAWTKLLGWLAEYTPAVAAAICEVDENEIKAAAELLANASYPNVRCNSTTVATKATTLLYAMGATQSTYGAQKIRAYALFQTILGNMGKFGGGINALRGIHNVQGSTDMGLLYGNMPAYSSPPAASLTNRAKTVAAGGAVRAANVVTVTTTNAHGFATGDKVVMASVANVVAASPGGAVRTTNVVTITTTADHGLSAGESVTIASVTPVGATNFNGTFTVVATPTTATFTYAQVAADDTGGGGTVISATNFNGTYSIASVPTPTTFTYAETGNAGTAGAGSATSPSGALGYIQYMNDKMFGNPYGQTFLDANTVPADTSITVKSGRFDYQLNYEIGDKLYLTDGTNAVTVTVGAGWTAPGVNPTGSTSVPIVGPAGGVDPVGVTFTAGTNGVKVFNLTFPTRSVGGSTSARYTTVHSTKPRGIQQDAFDSMTHYFFSDGAKVAYSAMDATNGWGNLHDFWAKDNGQNHMEMFEDMVDGTTTVAVIWGMNPANTEPNSKRVRTGLDTVPTLVCVDNFYNETGKRGESRNGGGQVTYLIPSCTFAERAGSSTNSGRWLQWRAAAIKPMGGSQSDLEILLHFAKALNTRNAFNHLAHIAGDKYTALFDGQYTYPATAWLKDSAGYTAAIDTLACNIYKQMCGNQVGQSTTSSGAIWIYAGAYAGDTGAAYVDGNNKAKIRNGADVAGTTSTAIAASGQPVIAATAVTYIAAGTPLVISSSAGTESANVASVSGLNVTLQANLTYTHPIGATISPRPGLYPNWGYAWLRNRRVFYNNGECLGDQGDKFVNADNVAQLWTGSGTTYSGKGYHSNCYRYYRTMAEADGYTAVAATGVPGGRFPKHWEPFESPRSDLVIDAKYGRNQNAAQPSRGGFTDYATKGLTAGMHEYDAADKTKYPYTLTTIRCVEHFQGGVLTRNVPWLTELTNEAWIEVNPTDATTLNIKDDDYVLIDSIRTGGIDAAPWTDWVGTEGNGGFKVIVSKRVKQGVVAIPWHWGDAGLVKGPSANMLTVPAGDANTTIPEYKAALVRIVKKP